MSTTVTAPATIWVLAVTTNLDGRNVSVHATRQDALAELRAAFDVAEWVADDDVAEEVISDSATGVLDIELGEHPTPRA